MVSYILVVLSFLVAFWYLFVYSRWVLVKHFWSQLRVPHDTPNPILGSLTWLVTGGNLSMVWMRELYEKYPGLVGIWSFWRPVLVVNSPALARRVMQTDANNFMDRFASAGKSDFLLSRSIFLAKKSDWSILRRQISPLFTAMNLRNNFNGLMDEKAKELVMHLRNITVDKKYIVDLYGLSSDYTTDVVGSAVFGITGDATRTWKGLMRDITKDLNRLTLYNGMSWLCVFFFPRVAEIFNLKTYPKTAVDALKCIFEEAVTQKGGYRANIKKQSDLISCLIKMKQNASEEGQEVDIDLLLSQTGNLLHAGFHTPAMIIAYALYELAYAPQIQATLRNEIDDAFNKNNKSQIDTSTLIYLKCVIKETLRKYPPVGWVDRVAAQDYEINENITIPSGTPVFINIIGLHYDSEFHPEPEIFRPERFLPENQTNLKSFTYLPFGEGPRRCIAGNFGTDMISSALFHIVLNYELHPRPSAPPPSRLHFVERSPLIYPVEQLAVVFEQRNLITCYASK